MYLFHIARCARRLFSPHSLLISGANLSATLHHFGQNRINDSSNERRGYGNRALHLFGAPFSELPSSDRPAIKQQHTKQSQILYKKTRKAKYFSWELAYCMYTVVTMTRLLHFSVLRLREVWRNRTAF